MSGLSVWTSAILVVACALLLHAAWTDLQQYKIRNDFIMAFAALFVLLIAVSGQWSELLWHFVFALLMFAVMLVFYTQRWMGGGDVKILTVAFLWTGTAWALPFAVLLALFAAAHSLAAKLGWAGSRDSGKQRRIPFAPSVAGALIVTFLLGGLQPFDVRAPLQDLLAPLRNLHY